MSQKRTVVPGMEPNGQSYSPGGGATATPGGGQGFYQPRGQRPAKGTYVQGMDSPAEPAGVGYGGGTQPFTPHQQTAPRANAGGKPVLGFLYSISRTPQGEFWPLYQGPNTIGQSADCDVQLPESTVSGEHAVLVVRKQKNPERVIASIADSRSTNGTMLNDESLGFVAVECHNGDLITVGDNYTLYLILVDAAAIGLSVAEGFIPVATQQAAADNMFGDDFDPNATRDGYGPDPFGGQTHGGPQPYTPVGGTVGLDGSSGFNGHGGTVGL